MKKNVIFIAIPLVVVLTLLLFLFVQPSQMTNEELSENGLFVFDNPRTINDFSLIDQHNNSVDASMLQDKWSLLFFGYTFCPDICPLTMATLNQFSGLLYAEESFQDDTQVIMVSVDPRRDTPEKLNEYVGFFNDEYLGLSGEYIEIFKFATQLNIAFAYSPGEDEDYLVSHSGEIVLVNPNGEFHGFFKVPHDPVKMAENYAVVRTRWD